VTDPFLQKVRAAFERGDVRQAEAMVRQRLVDVPADREARVELARLLRARGSFVEALGELDAASGGSGSQAAPLLRASILTRLGRHDEAIAAQRQAIAEDEHPRALLGLTHLLKTVGRIDEAAEASRRALAIEPGLGEAWWSLSSLKTVAFDEKDRDAMVAVLADPATDDGSRMYLHFALARAFDAAGDADRSWHHLADANAIRSKEVHHRPENITALVDATIRLMTSSFFASREDWGDPTPGPIFVLGMPRSGSTLLEQMLASHSAIEGTSELPYIPALVRQLGGTEGVVNAGYLRRLAALDSPKVSAIGKSYLNRSRAQRRTDRPYFVDKMPNNWLFVGLIALILPNARIIDIRRNPLDCGLSNFRELFARGQTYSYDLAHIGQYYRDYLRLMRHFDVVRPGLVHRVIYEQLVDDPKAQLSATFGFLGLAFEPDVLSFHQTDRGVRTASAGQVRQPLNRKGLDQWRRYDRWLEPLRKALGENLDNWQD
jgi:tetratricopeptide (TPR) repeat protein